MEQSIITPPPDVIDAESDTQEEPIDRTKPEPPPPELVDAVVRYFNVERATLQNKISDMESLLGFIRDDAAPLAVRVAKLEAFLGLKG